MFVHVCVYSICIYIYIHIYTHVCVYIYIYTYLLLFVYVTHQEVHMPIWRLTYYDSVVLLVLLILNTFNALLVISTTMRHA